jgi:hypothetical protein
VAEDEIEGPGDAAEDEGEPEGEREHPSISRRAPAVTAPIVFAINLLYIPELLSSALQ